MVPVGEDGRCDLGHRVFTPVAAFEQTQPLSHVDIVPPDTGNVDVPAAPIAGLAAAGLAMADTAALDEEETQAPAPDVEPDAEPNTEDTEPPAQADTPEDTPADPDEDDDEPMDFSAELDW